MNFNIFLKDLIFKIKEQYPLKELDIMLEKLDITLNKYEATFNKVIKCMFDKGLYQKALDYIAKNPQLRIDQESNEKLYENFKPDFTLIEHSDGLLGDALLDMHISDH